MIDEPEELDELEELDEFDSLDSAGSEDELCCETDPENDCCERKKYLSETNPFKNCIFPVMFINNQLKILFANEASEKLFSGFRDMQGQYLTDIFGKFFNFEEIRDIRETALKGTNGYCWKGEVKVKSRIMTTTHIKVFLFPHDITIKHPTEFIVMFDNVTEEYRSLLRTVFLSLLEASRLKDNDTGQHIFRVNNYSRCLAAVLYNKKGYERIDADFIDNIGFLASMHDVGKIGTPDDILNKEGPLSDWEWTVMQEHTKNGAFILSTYPHPMAKEIALSHHERWNGSGYPFRLEGDMIPLAARIVSIADVYDALRMKRSYKPALSHKTTVEKMMESKNSQFDPALLDVFYNISENFNEFYNKIGDKSTTT